MKKMSMRQERVAEQIKDVISSMLLRGDFADPRMNGMINIPHIWISPDMRQARAYYTSLSAPNATREEMRELTLAMNNEGYRIQKELGKQLSMKYTPKVHFFYDAVTQDAHNIEKAFARMSERENFNGDTL